MCLLQNFRIDSVKIRQMEVPGKKKSMIANKNSKLICDPCDSNDETEIAESYCIDCNEFLCKGCANAHKKSKLSNHHKLLESDKMPKKKFVLSCDNTCSRHDGKFLEYFCKSHNEICCTSCVTLEHRSCKLEYFSEKAMGFESGKDYRALKDRIQKMKQKISGMKDKIHSCQDEAKSKHLNFMEQIQEFRNNIETIIEGLVDNATEKAELINRENLEKLKLCSTRSDEMAEEIDDIVEEMKLLSACKQKKRLCIAAKQVATKMDIFETKIVDIETKTRIKPYSFRGSETMKVNIESWASLELLEFDEEPSSSDELSKDESEYGSDDYQKEANFDTTESVKRIPEDGASVSLKPGNECKTDKSKYGPVNNTQNVHHDTTQSVTRSKSNFVQDLWSTANVDKDITFGFAFGTAELFDRSCPAQADQTRQMMHLKKIYIRHKRDTSASGCLIAGMIKLTHSRLLLVDYNNHSLKIVDVDRRTIISYVKLACRPWDTTLVGNDKVVVSCCDRLIFFRVDEYLIKTKEVDIKAECSGIASKGNELFLTFISPRPCLKVLNMEGVVLLTIPKNPWTDIFTYPNFVLPCSKGKEVIVSDGKRGLLTIQKDGSTTISSEGILQTPFGMTPGPTGAIFVAGRDSNNVIEISEPSGEQRKANMRVVLTKVTRPLALVYMKATERLYVSHDCVVPDYNDYLSVFQL